uniref:Predicted protein n=1 Tax=Hordeum vulgare subsp. vulgare TaxID=112509 RepID=F2CSP2_HORVV|nr:predicted protein [Hordeum vulgare subsp. vulgare]
MDILVSAIAGDLVSRLASFVISKYFRQQPGIDMILQRLQRVVQRMDTVVEEADGRRITNQGMLRQLKTLRQGMYTGHYILDALRFQAAHVVEVEVSHSLTSALLSESSSLAKRLRFSGGAGGDGSSSNREAAAPLTFGANNSIREELHRLVSSLEDTMDTGMKEFLFFLETYPLVLRQPYAAYLLLENCMFGRQTEREQVLDFLLHPAATPILAVLPIVGPLRSGKTTLVEHICRDDNVRSHFSTILFFPEGSLEDERVIDLRGSSNFKVRHQKHYTQSHSKFLVIVETSKDINERAWRSLKSCVTRMAPCGGSKIIVTSRSERIVDLGTTEALRLGRVPREAYWYFFKSLAFGSMDPDEHPSMAVMAMEISSEYRQCLMGGHMVARLLRDNFSPRFWRAVLGSVRAYRNAHHPMCEDGQWYHWRLGRSCEYFVISGHYQSDSSEQVPKISVQEIILGRGGALPKGKFAALAWRSCIPPYYNYTVSCMMSAPQPTAGTKRKEVCAAGGRTLGLSL